MKNEKTTTQDSMDNKNTNIALPFGKSNYLFMLIGLGLIVSGYVIMTMDKEEFGFGFMGLTLGPVVAFFGFVVEFYAILKKKA